MANNEIQLSKNEKLLLKELAKKSAQRITTLYGTRLTDDYRLVNKKSIKIITDHDYHKDYDDNERFEFYNQKHNSLKTLYVTDQIEDNETEISLDKDKSEILVDIYSTMFNNNLYLLTDSFYDGMLLINEYLKSHKIKVVFKELYAAQNPIKGNNSNNNNVLAEIYSRLPIKYEPVRFLIDFKNESDKSMALLLLHDYIKPFKLLKKKHKT